jgi:hypothetical protein
MQVNWREIRTLEEIREIRERGEGYVVITDIANPRGIHKIHKPSCRYVREKYFREKVIENGCRNGRYYWVDSVRSYYFGLTNSVQIRVRPGYNCNPP